jgi:hypothetical protein
LEGNLFAAKQAIVILEVMHAVDYTLSLWELTIGHT